MAAYIWDKKTGRYLDTSNNRFVSRNIVLKQIDRINNRSKIYMRSQAIRLVSRQISLSQFQALMIDEIKRSHLCMGLLSCGGKDNVSKANYGAIGNRLKEEYQYLTRFALAIANGELSEKQIINRASMYSNSSASAFYKSEQISKIENRMGRILLAKRDLDPGVFAHCSECPALSTNGKYLPVEQVKIPTRACSCRSRCRCRITYKYSRIKNVSSTQ